MLAFRAGIFKSLVCGGAGNPFMSIKDGLTKACEEEQQVLKQTLMEDLQLTFNLVAEEMTRLNNTPSDLSTGLNKVQINVQKTLQEARAGLSSLRGLLVKSGISLESSEE
jgi:hypothetical protein